MHLYLSPGTGPFWPLKLFDRPAIHPYFLPSCSHFLAPFFFNILFSFNFLSLLLTASGLSSHQHTLRIRLSDGITLFFLPIPFLLPYLQSCDGTVCPDHVGLCIIFTQIYPTMTNPPISVRGDATTRGRIIVRFASASSDSR